MSIHRLIREGRERLGLSAQQFAQTVGVSRGAVQQWEKRGGTAPNRSHLPRVAELLGLSVAQLVAGGSYLGPGFDVRAEVAMVSDAEAVSFTAIDNFKPSAASETVPVTVPIKRHTYAWRVRGDSMVGESSDSFPPGSVLIVEPEMEALPGDYVLAHMGGNEVTFKQLIKDGGDFYLRPLNLRYPLKPLGDAKVIGVVRELTKRFR